MSAEDDIARLIAEKKAREQNAKEKVEVEAREIAENVARAQALQDAAKARWTDIVDVIQGVHSAYAVKARDLGIVVGGEAFHGANAFQSRISNAEGTFKYTILISMSPKNTLHCRIDTDDDGRKTQGQTTGFEGQTNEIEAIYAEIVQRAMTSSN